MKNRARWVVCGNKEKAVYEWFEVFSAVAHLTSLRLFLAVVAVQDLECHAFDIVTAFLNANIPPGFNIYIRQPSGFEDGSGRACKLKKALYGLRLSLILWLETLTTALREMGFEPLKHEACLFKNKQTGVLILVYMDDFLIAIKKGV